eukprot:7050546-Prymnesium_polylepis.1
MHLGDVISKDAYFLFLLRTARLMSDASFESLQQPPTRDALVAGAKDRTYDHRLFYELLLRGLLPGVAAVEVQLKHGGVMSEFTRYRYNVLLHVGPPVEALPLVTCAPSAASCLEEAVQAIAAVAAAGGDRVVVLHDMLNARLAADEQLASGIADPPSPAVQRGVGAAGGIDPAELRDALAAALPASHVVLTWAKSAAPARMDVYVMPSEQRRAGLCAVTLDAFDAFDSTALGGVPLDVDRFTNQLASAEAAGAGSKETELSDA